MSWMEYRSEIDLEIANCYSQIEELKNKIKELEARKTEEKRMDGLVKQLLNKEEINNA